MTLLRLKEARRRDYMPYSYRMASRFFHSAQYYTQHCTLQTFEQFGVLYMHNFAGKNQIIIRPINFFNFYPLEVAPPTHNFTWVKITVLDLRPNITNLDV